MLLCSAKQDNDIGDGMESYEDLLVFMSMFSWDNVTIVNG